MAEPASRDRRDGNISLLSWDPSPCADQCPKFNGHARVAFRPLLVVTCAINVGHR